MKASELAKLRLETYKQDKLSPPPKILLPGICEGQKIALTQKKHRLSIIGGMPGAGKTAYILQTALSLSEQGFVVLICTYEMHENAIIDRLWSNGYEIPCDNFSNYSLPEEVVEGLIDDERLNRIFVATPRSAAEVQKYITDNIYSDPDLAEMRKPEVIIIYDYLQRIPFHPELSTPKEKVSASLQDILNINNTLDVHSIVLASLNREGYHLTGMEAFKEAGDIEFDADMAIIMRIGKQNRYGYWQPVGKDELATARKSKQVNIIFNMVKNRHGGELEYVMGFDKSVQKFHNETFEIENNDTQEVVIERKAVNRNGKK